MSGLNATYEDAYCFFAIAKPRPTHYAPGPFSQNLILITSKPRTFEHLGLSPKHLHFKEL